MGFYMVSGEAEDTLLSTSFCLYHWSTISPIKALGVIPRTKAADSIMRLASLVVLNARVTIGLGLLGRPTRSCWIGWY